MKLTVDHLSCILDGKQILNDVSIIAEDRKFVTLMGPNGCGKTTLLKNIYQEYKTKNSQIYLDGELISSIPRKKLAQKMAVVSQFNDLNFDCSVYDVVLMGRTPFLSLLQQERKEDYQIADEALQEVGMYDKKNRSYLSLSGGEKQRVVLARAIAQKPKLLLLDEPTNHLDIRYQLEILRIVKKMNITVLAVLHDLQLASKFTDYIYLMKEGKILHAGSTKEVITEENIKEIYGVDCTVQTGFDNELVIQYK